MPGPVTEMLLSVVAIDDAVAILAFGFSVAIAGALGGRVRHIINTAAYQGNISCPSCRSLGWHIV